MVGWHHRLDGHEFEQAPGVGDRQGSLVCCGPWDHKESKRTERLNNNTHLCSAFLCRHKFSVHLGKYQGAQLLDHMGSRASFVRNCQSFIKAAVPFCISHQPRMRVSLTPHSSPAFGFLGILDFGHSE